MSSENQCHNVEASKAMVGQKICSNSIEEEFTGQTSLSENSLSGGCEHQSRVKEEVVEGVDMSDKCSLQCGETSSQYSCEIESKETFTEHKSGLQNIDKQHLKEQRHNLSADSNSELYDNDELADLLRRYHAKCNSDVTAQPNIGEREGVNGLFEDSLSGGYDGESRVKREVEECANMNYNPCAETVSQHSSGSDSNDRLSEENFMMQDIEQQHASEHSSNDSMDSSSEASDNEEFTDLFQRCYPESSSVCIEAQCDTTTLQTVEERRLAEGALDSSRVRISKEADPEQPVKAFKTMEHLKLHTQRVQVKNLQYGCSLCDKSFSLRRYLKQHVNHVHGDKKFNCDQCGCSFSYNHRLQSHITAVHLEQKSHQCPLCNSCFSEKVALTRHVRSVHNQEKPFECQICNKSFSTQQVCNDHMKAVHCEEKPFTCDKCDYKTARRVNLTRHKRAVHEGVKGFQCALCTYKCATNCDLKKHLTAVHQNQKDYPCTECDKAFTQASDVKRHIDAVHRGLKPHTCAVCNKNFSARHYLRKHIQAVHLK